MPIEKMHTVSKEDLRHAEYYDMQRVFDDLYARSMAGEIFSNLMEIVLSRNNILLAYRNIKSNTGSNTAGTDKLTIKDIGKMPVDEMVEKVRLSLEATTATARNLCEERIFPNPTTQQPQGRSVFPVYGTG